MGEEREVPSGLAILTDRLSSGQLLSERRRHAETVRTPVSWPAQEPTGRGLDLMYERTHQGDDWAAPLCTQHVDNRVDAGRAVAHWILGGVAR
jgi:hypothetical protein